MAVSFASRTAPMAELSGQDGEGGGRRWLVLQGVSFFGGFGTDPNEICGI